MGSENGSRPDPRPKALHSLTDALFSVTQQRLLALLFGQPGRSFTQRELIQLSAGGTGAIQRELRRMVASGLVSTSLVGRQTSYQASSSAPIFEELRSIVEKTLGVAETLRTGLEALSKRVSFAILYGSVAGGSDRASSDIDVLIVSDELALGELFAELEPIERRLGRKVSPTLYTREDFARRVESQNPFLTKVLARPYQLIFGSLSAASSTR